jgi:hypothetical protein
MEIVTNMIDNKTTKQVLQRCSNCETFLPLSAYHKDITKKSNLRKDCKECRSKVNQIYYKTVHGHLTSIYNAMKTRCNLSNTHTHFVWYHGVKLLVTKEDFISWSKSAQSGYMKLYHAWKKFGYIRTLSPSIDRIDSDLHYSLDNMQWLSLSTHSTKTNNHRWRNV